MLTEIGLKRGRRVYYFITHNSDVKKQRALRMLYKDVIKPVTIRIKIQTILSSRKTINKNKSEQFIGE
jgi:hypothetical protein